MPTLTREQITTLAANAGFTGGDIPIAVAVAFAESGGRTEAHNTKGQDDSYGLWQINMKGSLGPDRRPKFGITKDAQLFDPATNAKAAKVVHASSGWKAWTTYTSGAYKEYLDGAPSDVSTPSAGGSGITGAFNAFGDTIFKAASNFAGVLIAIVLLIAGILLLARNVIPAGKAIKAVNKIASD